MSQLVEVRNNQDLDFGVAETHQFAEPETNLANSSAKTAALIFQPCGS